MSAEPVIPIEQHIAAMRRYARALTRNDAAADDLTQDALLRACEQAAHYDRSRPLLPWLFAILHNQFVDGRRRQAAEQRRDAAFADQQALSTTDGVAPDMAAYLRQIGDRFAALPDQQRAVLHLVAVEGLNYREAADALGIPAGTVMSRLSRARAALRDQDAAPIATLHIVGGRDAR